MAQAVWVGTLSFGLVNIPVRLYSATAPKRVRFHQYDAQTGRRIRYQRVATGPALEEDRLPPDEESPPVEDAAAPLPEDVVADQPSSRESEPSGARPRIE